MDENEPVEDSEFVYRRIHRTFHDPSVAISFRAAAFRPNAKDSTGLSFFRSGYVSPAATLANVDSSKSKDYFVARLSVGALRKLGLTVVPEPVPGGPPGHAVVPELSGMVIKPKSNNGNRFCWSLPSWLVRTLFCNRLKPFPSSGAHAGDITSRRRVQ